MDFVDPTVENLEYFLDVAKYPELFISFVLVFSNLSFPNEVILDYLLSSSYFLLYNKLRDVMNVILFIYLYLFSMAMIL